MQQPHPRRNRFRSLLCAALAAVWLAGDAAGTAAADVGPVLGSPELGQIAELRGGTMVASDSRGQELEADRLGVATLKWAGYYHFDIVIF